jgi:hypothetical protein
MGGVNSIKIPVLVTPSVTSGIMTFGGFMVVALAISTHTVGIQCVLAYWLSERLTEGTCLLSFPVCKSCRVSFSQFPRLFRTRVNASVCLVTRFERESAFCLILFASTCGHKVTNECDCLLTRHHTCFRTYCHHLKILAALRSQESRHWP